MLFLCKQKLDLAEIRGMLPPDIATPWNDCFCHWQTQWTQKPFFLSIFHLRQSWALHYSWEASFFPDHYDFPFPVTRGCLQDCEGQDDILLNSTLNFQKHCPSGHVGLKLRKHPAGCVAQTPRSLCPGRLPVLDQDFLALPLLWDYIFFF